MVSSGVLLADPVSRAPFARESTLMNHDTLHDLSDEEKRVLRHLATNGYVPLRDRGLNATIESLRAKGYAESPGVAFALTRKGHDAALLLH